MPIRFCPGCNNLLIPREDIENKILEYVCRRDDCGAKETAKESLVEKVDFKGTSSLGGVAEEDYAMHADDYTLQRQIVDCVNPAGCPGKKAVVFMNPYRLDPENMSLIQVCDTCRYVTGLKQ
eukprot:PhF_6_TR29003/c0_g1_i1/m.42261/K03017/RPB9, POLR2I; DNA-directed RNA polymerase II subunit RPB9